jgi:hypothetical protein
MMKDEFEIDLGKNGGHTYLFKAPHVQGICGEGHVPYTRMAAVESLFLMLSRMNTIMSNELRRSSLDMEARKKFLEALY